MTNLILLFHLSRAARKLAAACAFATGMAAAMSAQTNTFPSSGNAGIGTTNFDGGTSGLQIQPASRGKFGVLLTDTDGSRSGGLYVDSDGFGHLYLYDSGGTLKIRLAASSGDHTYFNSGGNVGINTATPSQKLSVIGNGLFGNLTSRTLLYSTYDSQENPFLEVGYGTSHSAITPFPVFVLSNNTTSTSNGEGLMGQFVFANRSIADNNDKRTAVITSWVDGASNSGTLQFYTNSAGTVAERLRINPAGYVGIGTTSPGSLLQIANAAQPTITVETTGTTAKGRLTGAVPDWLGITQNARFDGANWNLDNTSLPGWLLKLDSRGSADVFEIARFSAGTNPRTYTPLFTIDSAGDVGIGTSSSNVAYKLDVNGAINATGLNVNGAPVYGSQWANGSGGNINFTSGNVGIGTTSPSTKLDVQGNFSVTGSGQNDTAKILSTSSVSGGAFIQNTQGSGQAVIYVENNRGSYASYGGFLYGGSNNTLGPLFGASRPDKMFLFADGLSNLGMAVGTLSAQPLILGTSNAERMRIDSSGKVGIGINNPTYKLHVQDGQINASGGLCINGQCKSSWSEVGGSQWSGSSNIFYNTGNVGIGTDSPGSGGYGQSRFDVVGRLRSRAADANITAGLWLNDSPSASGATDQAFIGRSLSATTGFWNATGGWVLNVHDSGKVGIGKSDPTVALDVQGDIKASGTIFAKYQDLAEWVPSSEQLATGTVVVLDTTKSNQVISASVAYDTRVAGVISAQPGITLGEAGEGKVLVATTGRVRVKVDASRGAIQIGDLLVTSDVAGVAMKSEPVEFAGRKMHMPGTIIGKALEPLAKGAGEILVLLSLQ